MNDKPLLDRDDIVGLIGERVNDDAWAERSRAEVERAAAVKALTDAADDVDARWEDTGLGAVGASWLRARAESYRQERKDDGT